MKDEIHEELPKNVERHEQAHILSPGGFPAVNDGWDIPRKIRITVQISNEMNSIGWKMGILNSTSISL